MAHQIETAADGRAAFAARDGLSAWHRLGTVKAPDEVWTAQQAIEKAFLNDWDVRKNELFAGEDLPTDYTAETGDSAVCEFRDGLWQPRAKALYVPDKYATVRTNPFDRDAQDVLGVVGSQYTCFQIEQQVETIQALCDEAEADIQTAGSLRDGRETFVTAKLPREMLVGGEDAVTLYLSALNTHDGTKPQRFNIGPVRIVCANTQALSERMAKSTFSIAHRSGGHAKIEEIRKGLDMAWKFADVFEAEAEKMIQTELTNAQFGEMMDKLFPKTDSESKRAATTYTAKREALANAYLTDPTGDKVRGTRWGGYQAVTRYMDYFAPVSGQKTMSPEVLAHARAERTLTAHAVAKVKADAFDLFAVK